MCSPRRQGACPVDLLPRPLRSAGTGEGEGGLPGAALPGADPAGADDHGSRLRLWKTELAEFAAQTGLRITVCHLPPAPASGTKSSTGCSPRSGPARRLSASPFTHRAPETERYPSRHHPNPPNCSCGSLQRAAIHAVTATPATAAARTAVASAAGTLRGKTLDRPYRSNNPCSRDRTRSPQIAPPASRSRHGRQYTTA